MVPAPVSVLIPTHDHAATLPFSVASVQTQELSDIDIVIVGDGVGDDTRDVVATLIRNDERVRFVDAPKSGRTGEPTRHRVVAGLESSIVAYHGDDDLMFPDHLATMVALLQANDFVHPLPIFVGPQDALMLGHFDARRTWWRDSVQPPLSRNVISLTGVAHTLDSYRRLPFGWRGTPLGIKTDHYMWQQYFTLSGLRAATGDRATVVKLDSAMRKSATTAERVAEISRWESLINTPGFQAKWDARVAQERRRSRLRGAAVATTAVLTAPTGPEWWLRVQAKTLDFARNALPVARTLRN